ncbi:MAG: hypothetical protein L0Y56_18335, partial [Nitrospira sp.]|nr:hypothetical protein [Nitrospira sp.]
MNDSLDFERFEKEVRTFAQIKKKYERLLREFYSEEAYKGSYVDRATIEKAVELAKQDDNYRTKAFAIQHLVNHRIIEYLACLQVQIDNLHQFLNLMLRQMGKEVPKAVQSALKKLQEDAHSTTPPTTRRRAKDRRSLVTRRLIYDLNYRGDERRKQP